MIMKMFKHIIIPVIILIVALPFILKPIKIDGNSMYPALEDGNWVLVDRASFLFLNPKKGDIIVFNGNDPNRQYVIKRIVGLEYEAVEIISGFIYINDKIVEEKYATHFREDNFNKRIIPKDHFFVLGDNRKVSVDSRYEEVGFIYKNNIVGKIIFKW